MLSGIADLERAVRALSTEDKQRLLNLLMTELGAPDRETEALVREFVAAVERTDESLSAALERICKLDDDIERAAAEARKRVLASGELWPFAPV